MKAARYAFGVLLALFVIGGALGPVDYSTPPTPAPYVATP